MARYRKLLVLGCKTMREGVMVSSIFFLGAVVMIGSAVYLIPDIWYFKQIILFLGLILMLFAPIILISTFLLSILLESKHLLDDCEH
jgi:hypothetical protein